MMSEQWPSPEPGSNPAVIQRILSRGRITQTQLAQYLGTSRVQLSRWLRGDILPDSPMRARLAAALDLIDRGLPLDIAKATASQVFASRGARRASAEMPLFADQNDIEIEAEAQAPVISRLRPGDVWGHSAEHLAAMLAARHEPALTLTVPPECNISAGKNTYTYDAHTYHTKVPPQGIAQILAHYLPRGGIVLDPFAGSGMTGVAALTLGMDVVLNDLSPAASFIADRFTRRFEPARLAAAVRILSQELDDLRRALYTTHCRECGRAAEILFTVWSYRVRCPACGIEFLLWDHCRHYGNTVREHKILREFPCPGCAKQVHKSRLPRTAAEPVLLGYKCCSRIQVEHPLNDDDRRLLSHIEKEFPPRHGYFPQHPLPDGVNLNQPKRHGLTSVDRFYTRRNLAAMSAIWHFIHRVNDIDTAGFLAFVFTSLYQRVTKLSEFRFWGGSGNTANFNVPYVFNETNVFVTFERKAKSIQDHLATTAKKYSGRAAIRTGPAADLSLLPNDSIDFIFTDPPFGANINYSEMNIIWESWFECFTNNAAEAVINRYQNKGTAEYGQLMADSLRECHRVLRDGHWLVLVFMNSSKDVWQALREAVLTAGFKIERIDIFDKQHGTFKQFVSDNTAGCDLLLHCRKVILNQSVVSRGHRGNPSAQVRRFLDERHGAIPKLPYLHVIRDEEIDYRMLYSEYVAARLTENDMLIDFPTFRQTAAMLLKCD